MTGYNIEVRQYDPLSLPDIDVKEVWRYCGCRDVPSDEAMISLMDEVLSEYGSIARGKVCFVRAPHLPFRSDSKGLAKVIEGSREVIVFAATVGLEFDRLIGRFKRTSPSKALILQALGAERVEALCDLFCSEFDGRTSRYSPGYGDMPLESQKDVFELLRPESKIGISLNESLLMTPSKSVTAIFGLRDQGGAADGHDCSLCGLLGCEYRRIS
ncbi:Vitamin B12 dependent methionine synthase, activation domain [Ruminococcaceae bacterium YRB3002]|nr:Vitamin B12 dependent methionine synthase, activation domain [Ruminococcaceae bacterium YRB3002]